MAASMSLKIQHLCNFILQDICLEVPSGETLVITGPSGAGKTTLLRVIAGLDVLDKGNILLKEKEITSLPPYQRNIAMVFQNHALFPNLTVFQNITFPLKRKGIPSKQIYAKADCFLQAFQISHLAKRYPSHLSGGEKQRVAIAQVLMLEPSSLLLDEPLCHLDTDNQKILQKELKDFQRKHHIPMIYITHDEEEAKIMGNHFAIMRKGRLAHS